MFIKRGVIQDRNGIDLVWNEYEKNTKGENIRDFPLRKYIKQEVFSHILGFVSYPKKDQKNIYYEKEYTGKGGVEKYFNNILNGKLGQKIIIVDAFNKIFSENVYKKPQLGKNLKLTIDSKIQAKFFSLLKDYSKKYNFQSAAGVIMDVKNGEILSFISYPEFDSNVLTDGKDRKKILEYIEDNKKPFLNRVTYAEFTPGSVMKIFVALGALEEDIVNPNKFFETNGKLIIENPYFPDKPSIFRDWKNHGFVNMYKAIANSSNIYFYILGGRL